MEKTEVYQTTHPGGYGTAIEGYHRSINYFVIFIYSQVVSTVITDGISSVTRKMGTVLCVFTRANHNVVVTDFIMTVLMVVGVRGTAKIYSRKTFKD